MPSKYKLKKGVKKGTVLKKKSARGKNALSFVNNKNIRKALIGLVVAYSAYAVVTMDKNIVKLFDNNALRIASVLVTACVLYCDRTLGLVVAGGFGVSMFVNQFADRGEVGDSNEKSGDKDSDKEGDDSDVDGESEDGLPKVGKAERLEPMSDREHDDGPLGANAVITTCLKECESGGVVSNECKGTGLFENENNTQGLGCPVMGASNVVMGASF